MEKLRKEIEQFSCNSRVVLRGWGSVNCKPVKSPRGTVIEINHSSSMLRIRFADGATHWYAVEDLDLVDSSE